MVKCNVMIPAAGYRGRFAPSPTGTLHFGSLLAAFGSWLRARHAGGEWLVRIEDVDTPRTVPGAAQAQLATLAAFGLHWDGDVLHQSKRGDLYQHALDRLLASEQAFICHCTRSGLAGESGIHRHCIARTTRDDPAVRLRVSDGRCIDFDDAIHGTRHQDVARDVGDFVLRRADGCWAYQLAVVIDDAAQGITEVVRGADLLDSTPRQILLQHALGLSTPAYAHLPLVVDGQGRKLSKSLAALPVDDTQPLPALRLAWQALGQDLAPLVGITRHDAWLDAAIGQFDVRRVPRGPLVYDALQQRFSSPATTMDGHHEFAHPTENPA